MLARAVLSQTVGGSVVRTEPGVVWRIVLARPEVRNAVSREMSDALRASLTAAADDPACRAVVLAGEGRDFCAGADLGELAEAREGRVPVDYGWPLEEVLAAVEDQPQPVVAEVQGAALGAGCLLALACDLAVAAEDARFAIPSARLGVVVGYESVERLVLNAGPKRAAELLTAGRTITGAEAAAWGIVNHAVPAAELGVAAAHLAAEVAALAPLSVRAQKRGVRAALERLRLPRGAERHRVADFDMMAAAAFASEDAAEGAAAFRDRRRPEFRGR